MDSLARPETSYIREETHTVKLPRPGAKNYRQEKPDEQEPPERAPDGMVLEIVLYWLFF